MPQNLIKALKILFVGSAAVGISKTPAKNPGPAGGVWPLVFAGLSMAVRPQPMWLHVASWLGLLLAFWWLESRQSKTAPSLLSGLVLGGVAFAICRELGPPGMLFSASVGYLIALILDVSGELRFRDRHGFYGTVLQSRDLSVIQDARERLVERGLDIHVRGYSLAQMRRSFALNDPIEIMVDGEDLELAEEILLSPRA